MFAQLSRPVAGAASITIAKPVQVVFDYVANHFFENYQKWAPEVTEFKPINNNPVKVGALARQTRIEQGQRVESTFEIVTLEPERLFILNGLSAPFRDVYEFQAIHHDESTLLSFTFELLELEIFMRPFEKLIRSAIEEGARNTVSNIKNLLVSDLTMTD